MLYKFGRLLFWLYYHLLFRVDVKGAENVPKDGGVILCSNHSSVQDPLVLAPSTKRQVHYIAKKEIFKNPFFGFVLRNLGAFPVDRKNVGMDTFKLAIKILEDKKVLGIFSQGTRVKEIDAKDAKAGVALFALKGNAEIVPVNITSTYKYFSKIYIRFGKPIDLSAYRGQRVKTPMLEEITDKIFVEIGNLSPDKE